MYLSGISDKLIIHMMTRYRRCILLPIDVQLCGKLVISTRPPQFHGVPSRAEDIAQLRLIGIEPIPNYVHSDHVSS